MLPLNADLEPGGDPERGFPRAAFLGAQPRAGCGACAGGTGLWLLSVKLQVPVGVQVTPKPT